MSFRSVETGVTLVIAKLCYNSSPFLSPKFDLKKHPNYKYTAEADKRNTFDPATLVSTKLIVKPDELFTVYKADVPDEAPIGKDILSYDDLDDPDVYA